jgi:type II secretory pathway component PulF
MAEKKKILTLLDNIEKVLFDRANAGEVITGVHLTNGRKQNKQWKKDIEPVEEMIKLGLHLDQVVKTTPITPTQAMKMTDVPDELYEQPEGKLKIEVEDVTEVLNELEDLT